MGFAQPGSSGDPSLHVVEVELGLQLSCVSNRERGHHLPATVGERSRVLTGGEIAL